MEDFEPCPVRLVTPGLGSLLRPLGLRQSSAGTGLLFSYGWLQQELLLSIGCWLQLGSPLCSFFETGLLVAQAGLDSLDQGSSCLALPSSWNHKPVSVQLARMSLTKMLGNTSVLD